MRTTWTLLFLWLALLSGSYAQPLDGPRLARLTDSLARVAVAAHRVPGAVVTVVHGGEVLLNTGIGFADLDRAQPVSGEQTVFRVASLSKIVTTVAVLQLVEQAKLDLHRDLRPLLPEFDLPGPPLTLAQLLTHSAGLDVRHLGRRARTGAEVPPLGDYLRAHLPPRVRPPGSVSTYSNHGMALVGEVIARASGQPFEAQLQQALFGPLGMHRSAFSQPEQFGDRLAQGYQGASLSPVPFVHFKTGPASMLMTTGADMARLMQALLEPQHPLLPASLKAGLCTPQFRHHPALPPMGYGFFLNDLGETREAVHTGNFEGFHAALYLYPEQQLGIFMAFNHPERGFAAREQLISAWRQALGLQSQEPRPRLETSPAWLKRFRGSYRLTRTPLTGLDKLLTFPGPAVEVKAGASGRLEVAGQTYRLRDRAQLLFQSEAGDRLAFRADPTGEVTYLFHGPLAYERLAWWESPFWQGLVGGLIGLGFLLAVAWVAWGRMPPPEQAGLGAFERMAALNGLLLGTFCLLWASYWPWYDLHFGLPALLQAGLWLPKLSVLAAAPLPGLALRVQGIPAWRKGLLLGLGLLAWLQMAWLGYWQLLG